jgi:hypothetical protein
MDYFAQHVRRIEMEGFILEEADWKIILVFGAKCLLLIEKLPSAIQGTPLLSKF